MPDTKISALTAGDPAQGTDQIPIARAGANFKVTAASIAALSPAGTVTSVAASGGTTGLTFTGSPITASGTLTLGGTLAAVNGGTGQTSYAVGDLLYASTTTALSKLADVATGNALISGGVGVAPSWGKVGLTTHVSGTLAVGNGGTGLTATPTNGQIDIGNGSGFTRTTLTAGTGITITNASGSITIAASGGGGGVTSFNTRTGAVTLSSSDVTGALGYTPLSAPVQTYQGGTGTTSSPTSGQLLIGTSFSTYNLATLTAGTGISITNASGAITIAASGGPTINLLSVSTTSGAFSNATPGISYSRPLIGHTVSAGTYGAFFFWNSTGGYLVTSTSVSSIQVTDTTSTMTSYMSGTDFGGPSTFSVYDSTVTCYGLNMYNSGMQAIFLASKNAINSNSFRPVDATNAFGINNPSITVYTSGSTYTNSSGQRGVLVVKPGGYYIAFASADTIPASGFTVNQLQFNINGSLSTYFSGSDFTSGFSQNSSNGQFLMSLTPSNMALQTLLDNSFL